MLTRTTAFLVLALVTRAQADERAISTQAKADVPPAAATRLSQSGVLTLPQGAVEVLNVERAARAVILGDPKIADAAVVDDRTIVVTAKTNGFTNLIVLDETNKEILRTAVRVQLVGRSIQVMHGDKPQSFSCSYSCEALSAPPPSTSYGTVTENRDRQGNLVGTSTSTTTTGQQGNGGPAPPGLPPNR